MLQYILRLPTARAALLALVGALLVFLRQTGIAVPAGLDHTLGVGIDVGLSFLTLLGSLSVMHRAEPPPPKDPPKGLGAMMLVLLALVVTGCAGSFEEARGTARVGVPPEMVERCTSLDNVHRTWGGIGKASAVLAGASGLAIIPSSNADLDLGLAIGAAATGALAAGAFFVSEDAAASYVRECSR